MPYADPEKRKAKNREYNKRWYENNRKQHQASVERNRTKYRQQWIDYKATLKCSHCGFAHPAAIDFHHLDRNDPTKRSVNALIGRRRYKDAHEEVKKCIPLCANCHRIHHFNETQDERAARKARRKKKKKENTP